MSEKRTKIKEKFESLGGHIRVSAEISIDKRLVEHYREASQSRAAEEAGDLLQEAVTAALKDLHARFTKSQARKDAAAAAERLGDRAARAGIDHAEESGRHADESASHPSHRGARPDAGKKPPAWAKGADTADDQDEDPAAAGADTDQDTPTEPEAPASDTQQGPKAS